MKLKKTKLLSLIMAAALVFESAGMNVVAANDTTNNDATPVVSIEEVVEDGGFGTTDGDVSEGDVTAGDVSEGDVTTGDVTAGDVTDGDVSEGDVEALFPGLPDGYVLSVEQIAAKENLATYTSADSDFAMQAAQNAYVEGELLYLTDSAEEAQMIADAFGGELESCELGVAIIRLPENRTVAQAVAAAANPNCNLPAVWPNHYRVLYVNDPALSDEYEGTSKESGYQWQHKFVGSATAWAAGYTGKGVKVGVIDSGILNSHVEFSGRLVKHMSIVSGSSSTSDANGHGTHVSGIIAANVNNKKGGAGIAPDASLYVYGVTDANGSVAVGATIRAINQAVKDGVAVVNMSIGGPFYNGLEEQAMTNACENGVALFAAAGNETSNGYAYPASYKNVCSIASLDRNGKKSGYTNYNSLVDLAFPGTEIYSTLNTGSYGYMSGTSMACPVATGVAAVILSGANDIPELKDKTGKAKVDALYNVMGKFAKKSSSAGTGKGTTYLPDVWGLTVDEMDQVPETPVFDLKNKSVVSSKYFDLKITSGTTKGVTIYYNKYGGTPKFSKDGKVSNYTGTITSGSTIEIGGRAKQTVKAIAVNHITGKASKVATATYTFKPNPTSVSITCANNTNKVVPGSKISLSASVSPSYAVSRKVAWSVENASGASVADITVKNGKVTVSKTAKAGIYYVVATAVDSKNNPYVDANNKKIQSKYQLEVLSSAKKVKKIEFAKDKKKVDATVGVPLSLLNDVTVTYEDGTTATGAAANLVWSTSRSYYARVDSNGNVRARNPGKATIKATVNDGSNKSASCTVTVVQLAEELYVSSNLNVLAKGKSGQMYASIYPIDTSNKSVVWSVAPVGSAGGKVTIAANGKISADNAASGTWRVTCKTADGSNLTKTYDIEVVNEAVKSITVPTKKIDLQVGVKAGAKSTEKINATINGGDVRAVQYYSSNSRVASVNYKTGEITARGSGKATITACAYDGGFKKATVTVNVTVPMSSVEIVPDDENSVETENGTAGIVYVGSSIKLSTVAGSAYGVAQNQNVIWSVAESDKDKVSISDKGVLKAKSVGNTTNVGVPVTVYAEAADGSGASDTYTVLVCRKLKAAKVVQGSGCLEVIQQYEGSSSWYYCPAISVKVSGPGGYKIGVRNLDSAFVLMADKDTTKKTSNFYTSDAITVTAKVRPLGSNKNITAKVYVLRSGDNYINQLK